MYDPAIARPSRSLSCSIPVDAAIPRPDRWDFASEYIDSGRSAAPGLATGHCRPSAEPVKGTTDPTGHPVKGGLNILGAGPGNQQKAVRRCRISLPEAHVGKAGNAPSSRGGPFHAADSLAKGFVNVRPSAGPYRLHLVVSLGSSLKLFGTPTVESSRIVVKRRLERR